jgi:hypothetical protein
MLSDLCSNPSSEFTAHVCEQLNHRPLAVKLNSGDVQGIAVGFVLLRVQSLVEEGKI